MDQGDLMEACAALEEACVAERAIGGSPWLWQNLATIAILEGDAETAERMFAECLSERDAWPPIGNGLCILGLRVECDPARGFHRAAALHGVADVVIEQAGQPFEDLEARLRTADLQTLHRALATPPGTRATSTAGSFRRRKPRALFSLHPRTTTAHSRGRPTHDTSSVRCPGSRSSRRSTRPGRPGA